MRDIKKYLVIAIIGVISILPCMGCATSTAVNRTIDNDCDMNDIIFGDYVLGNGRYSINDISGIHILYTATAGQHFHYVVSDYTVDSCGYVIIRKENIRYENVIGAPVVGEVIKLPVANTIITE